ncbi:hypothetical protein FKW77_004687 [Venturia effusa]|uniref:DUF1308 domain-containing protein n=1 Tax=Venturia effusa TaxID=50376 RepID=A0A517LNV5_9PEZI|nr:hypothetical protein FKW77_004687 [Venturia effusa]
MDSKISEHADLHSVADTDEETLVEPIAALDITPKDPEDVLARCNVLLGELKKFADYCDSRKYLTEYRRKVEYSHFKGDIVKEIEQMQKVGNLNKTVWKIAYCDKIKTQNLPPGRIHQLVTASNLTYWEALWSTAKQQKCIQLLRRHASPIDIISDSGLTWTKVSTITERRLLMEMAKTGWNWSDSDDDGFGTGTKDEDDMDIPIVKMAITLANLAKESRVRYRTPHVHFVLTRINSGNKDIDTILDRIRATGATLTTADQILPAPAIEDVLEDLVVDERKSFSETLNICCTILLAVVSDISHGQVKEEAWFNRNIRRQIEIEDNEHLMQNTLWPAMAGRDLVCTKIAMQRMREIVDLIGTHSEKERTKLFMGDDSSKSSEQLLEEFQKLSAYPIPSTWRLPIKIVDELNTDEHSPRLAATVAKELSDINESVFIYGWKTGRTTITSNRSAVKAIERCVEANRLSDDDVGPDAFIVPTARSLVAKEKERRDGSRECDE